MWPLVLPTRYTKQYCPSGATPYNSIGFGSTGTIWKHSTRAGVVVKAIGSHEDLEDLTLQHKYKTEVAILRIWARITELWSTTCLPPVRSVLMAIRFLALVDPLEPHERLLFAEADNGDVSTYLTSHGPTIDNAMRLKWCKQAAEGLAHCHA